LRRGGGTISIGGGGAGNFCGGQAIIN